MSEETKGWIEEHEAAILIGLPVAELRSLSFRNAFGQARRNGENGREPHRADAPLLFTCEELKKLSFVAAHRD